MGYFCCSHLCNGLLIGENVGMSTTTSLPLKMPPAVVGETSEDKKNRPESFTSLFERRPWKLTPIHQRKTHKRLFIEYERTWQLLSEILKYSGQDSLQWTWIHKCRAYDTAAAASAREYTCKDFWCAKAQAWCERQHQMKVIMQLQTFTRFCVYRLPFSSPNSLKWLWDSNDRDGQVICSLTSLRATLWVSSALGF